MTHEEIMAQRHTGKETTIVVLFGVLFSIHHIKNKKKIRKVEIGIYK